jgi:hypothetical protein
MGYSHLISHRTTTIHIRRDARPCVSTTQGNNKNDFIELRGLKHAGTEKHSLYRAVGGSAGG